jgi:hypothetical protein
MQCLLGGSNATMGNMIATHCLLDACNPILGFLCVFTNRAQGKAPSTEVHAETIVKRYSFGVLLLVAGQPIHLIDRQDPIDWNVPFLLTILVVSKRDRAQHKPALLVPTLECRALFQ